MKFGLKNIFKPTPAKMRKLGEAFLGIAAMGVPAEVAEYKWTGITLFVIGIVGKFITTMFTEDEGNDKQAA
jgi:hypothetical protein